MPTFVTLEQFLCGHSSVTCDATTGRDTQIISETLPVPTRCLKCVCESVKCFLDADIIIVPASAVCELEQHFRVSGVFGTGKGLGAVLRRVCRPSSMEGFRQALDEIILDC